MILVTSTSSLIMLLDSIFKHSRAHTNKKKFWATDEAYHFKYKSNAPINRSSKVGWETVEYLWK